jgi:hypothetical protein
MDNSTTDAYLTIGISENAYGVLTSEATPASNIGFDYKAGYLDIEYHSSATFDDEIDINTADPMTIGGFLGGTDNIYIGCDKGTTNICKIEPSGEVKVVDSTTDGSLITVERPFDLFGKLNGDGGAGDILIDDTVPGKITQIGTDSEDSYAYIHARNIEIEPGSEINLSNFENCYEPEGGETYGGSYGGEGIGPSGPGTATFGEIVLIGTPNWGGSSLPVGMCGFTSTPDDKNVNGGGSIYIEATGNLIFDGDIISNGADATSGATGAGSGGLIFIAHNIDHADTTLEFKGSGTIQANGGDGTVSNSWAGGGGRVVVASILLDDPDDEETTGLPHYQFDGTVEAAGGESTTSIGEHPYAAAGTIIYGGDNNSPNFTLIADQKDTDLSTYGATTNIPTTAFGTSFDRIEARNGAHIKYPSDPTVSPISCFEVDGATYTSTVEYNLLSCSNYKFPDLFI